jgi:hypothetical protein
MSSMLQLPPSSHLSPFLAAIDSAHLDIAKWKRQTHHGTLAAMILLSKSL